MGQKSHVCSSKHTFWYICDRSGPPQLGVVLVLVCFFNLIKKVNFVNDSAWICIIHLMFQGYMMCLEALTLDDEEC